MLFNKAGRTCKRKSPGRQVTEAKLSEAGATFVCSLKKSTRKVAQQLSVPQLVVHEILKLV
jgi:hypothetical protein